MCGIAGISLNPDDQKLNVRTVTAALLESIASRGPDATGAAWYDHNTDEVMLTKVAAPVHKFLAARMEVLPETTPVMILHTRYGTGGSALNRNNNHPIHYGNIIGVHNGVLWGDTEMWKEMGLKSLPDTQVDSEAIMALLTTASNPAKVMGKIKGDAALAWIDLDDPEVLHLAHAVGRTLAVAQTKEGSLIFASTMTALKQAATKSGLELEYTLDVPEGKYLKVKDGVILEYLDTPKPERNLKWARQYEWTNGGDRGYQGGTYSKKGNTTTPAKAVAAAKKATAAPKAITTGAGTTRKPDTVNLKQMVLSELVVRSRNGSVEAVAELLRRGYDAKGKYLNSKIDGIPVTTLVTMAAGGSMVAAEALESHGYDRAGVRTVAPVPDATVEFKEPAVK